MMTSPSEHRISKMALAAFLSYKGHPVERREWKDGVCTWVFDATDRLSQDATAFKDGRALVDPQDFFFHLNTFRKEMWESEPQESRSR